MTSAATLMRQTQPHTFGNPGLMAAPSRRFDAAALAKLQEMLAMQPNPSDSLAKQEGAITPLMRRDTLAWVQAIASRRRRTISRAALLHGIRLFDLFLSVMKVQPKHLNIIAVVCLHLAMECLQQPASLTRRGPVVSASGVSDDATAAASSNLRATLISAEAWSHLALRSFTANDFMRMESIVRRKLQRHAAFRQTGVHELVMTIGRLINWDNLPRHPGDDQGDDDDIDAKSAIFHRRRRRKGPPTSGVRLMSIPEDQSVNFSHAHRHRCLALVEAKLLLLLSESNVAASEQGIVLVLAALAIVFEDKYGADAAAEFRTVWGLTGVAKGDLYRALWRTSASLNIDCPTRILSQPSAAADAQNQVQNEHDDEDLAADVVLDGELEAAAAAPDVI